MGWDGYGRLAPHSMDIQTGSPMFAAEENTEMPTALVGQIDTSQFFPPEIDLFEHILT